MRDAKLANDTPVAVQPKGAMCYVPGFNATGAVRVYRASSGQGGAEAVDLGAGRMAV